MKSRTVSGKCYRDLSKKIKDLEQVALIDLLTGLPNRRCMKN